MADRPTRVAGKNGEPGEGMASVRVAAAVLDGYVAELFTSAGMSDDHARFWAHSLVQTNLWGKDSHGVLRVPDYLARLRSGVVNPRPRPRIVRGEGALEVMDGDSGPGFIAARDAMLRAIALAEKHGMGAVGVVESNHFGAAGLYVRLAVERGMVGVAMSNTVPKLIAEGATRPVVGSNPIAIGVPTGDERPFVADLSLSAVAGGKLLLASRTGATIEPGLAVDKDGVPTEDPARAFAGYWMAIGGLKGLALAYAVDILSGLITGGAFSSAVGSPYAEPTRPGRSSHLLMALKVGSIIDGTELKERMATYREAIESTPVRDGSSEMVMPGERAFRNERELRERGIPVSARLFDELVELGRAAGLEETLVALPPE